MMNEPPKVTGTIPDFEPRFYLIPTVGGKDFGINIHGSNENFLPLFTNDKALDEFMEAFCRNLGYKFGWATSRIDDVEAVHHIAEQRKLRIMIDPVLVSPTKTTWKERVKEGDLYKYHFVEN